MSNIKNEKNNNKSKVHIIWAIIGLFAIVGIVGAQSYIDIGFTNAFNMFIPGNLTVSGFIIGDGSQLNNTGSDFNWIDVTDYSGGDIGAQFNNAVAANGLILYNYIIPTGTYTVTTPLNMTGMVKVKIDGTMARLNCNTTGVPCIDATGTQNVIVQIGQIYGDPVNTPSSGIYHSSTAARNGDVFVVKETYITGYYDIAAITITGGERTHITDTWIINQNNQGYGLAASYDNNFTIGNSWVSESSVYETDIGRSMDHFWVDDVSIQSFTAEGDGLVYIQGAQDIKFEDSEFAALGEPMIVINSNYGRSTDMTFSFVRGRQRTEIDANEEGIFIQATGSEPVEYLTLENLDILLYRGAGSAQPLINATTNFNNLIINGIHNDEDSISSINTTGNINNSFIDMTDIGFDKIDAAVIENTKVYDENSYLLFNTGTTDGIRLGTDSENYVGIGTTDPDRLLHLVDDTTVRIKIEPQCTSNNCDAAIRLFNSTGDGSWQIFNDDNLDDKLTWNIFEIAGTEMSLNTDGNLTLKGSIDLGNTNTGGNAGSDICIDANGVLCICGSCA